MKVDVYSNMYNEELILPYWLRHYETFADRIFIWDGGSTDKTLGILKAHPKVTLLPRGQRGHDDDYYITELYPQYEKYSRGVSDWVIIADADEFIYHPHLLEVLEKAKKEKIRMILSEGFSMISDKFPTGNGQIYDEIKTGFADAKYSKWTIFSPDLSLRFWRGRHWRPHGSNGVARSGYDGLKLLHYRFIGKKYLENRTIKNIEGVKLITPGNTCSFTLESVVRCPNGENSSMLEWLAKYGRRAPNVIDEN